MMRGALLAAGGLLLCAGEGSFYVTPARGSVLGGTLLHVLGTEQALDLAGLTAVTVGGAPCALEAPVGAARVCTTAAGTGVSDVVLRFGSAQVTLAGAFTYATDATPRLEAVEPKSIEAGHAINVIGSGLSLEAWDNEVTLDATRLEPASAVETAEGGARASFAAGTAGAGVHAAALSVRGAGRAELSPAARLFALDGASGHVRVFARVTALTPTLSGPRAGELVTLTGAGLDGAAPTVALGGRACTVRSATFDTLECSLAAGEPTGTDLVAGSRGLAVRTYAVSTADPSELVAENLVSETVAQTLPAATGVGALTGVEAEFLFTSPVSGDFSFELVAPTGSLAVYDGAWTDVATASPAGAKVDTVTAAIAVTQGVPMHMRLRAFLAEGETAGLHARAHGQAARLEEAPAARLPARHALTLAAGVTGAFSLTVGTRTAPLPADAGAALIHATFHGEPSFVRAYAAIGGAGTVIETLAGTTVSTSDTGLTGGASTVTVIDAWVDAAVLDTMSLVAVPIPQIDAIQVSFGGAPAAHEGLSFGYAVQSATLTAFTAAFSEGDAVSATATATAAATTARVELGSAGRCLNAVVDSSTDNLDGTHTVAVSCVAGPASQALGLAPTVVLTGFGAADNPTALTANYEQRADAVIPVAAGTRGGLLVTIAGAGFKPAGNSVSIGGATAPVVSERAREIVVTAPALSAASGLPINVNGTALTQTFEANASLDSALTSVAPAGWVDRSRSVELTFAGTGLPVYTVAGGPAPLSIFVDGQPCQLLSSTATEAVCRLDPANAATATPVITATSLQGGEVDTTGCVLNTGFGMASVTPASASLYGGLPIELGLSGITVDADIASRITVEARGTSGAETVVLACPVTDFTAASVTCLPQSLSAVSPTLAWQLDAGDSSLTLTLTATLGASASACTACTLTLDATLTPSLMATDGVVTAGTVTVRELNGSADVGLSIAEVGADGALGTPQACTWTTPDVYACPATGAGARAFKILNASGVVPQSAASLVSGLDHANVYTLAPTLTGVTPRLGSQAGGVTLTIAGSGFGSIAEDVAVSVGGAPCEVSTVSDTSIACMTTAFTPLSVFDIVDVTVSVESADSRLRALAAPYVDSASCTTPCECQFAYNEAMTSELYFEGTTALETRAMAVGDSLALTLTNAEPNLLAASFLTGLALTPAQEVCFALPADIVAPVLTLTLDESVPLEPTTTSNGDGSVALTAPVVAALGARAVRASLVGMGAARSRAVVTQVSDITVAPTTTAPTRVETLMLTGAGFSLPSGDTLTVAVCGAELPATVVSDTQVTVTLPGDVATAGLVQDAISAGLTVVDSPLTLTAAESRDAALFDGSLSTGVIATAPGYSVVFSAGGLVAPTAVRFAPAADFTGTIELQTSLTDAVEGFSTVATLSGASSAPLALPGTAARFLRLRADAGTILALQEVRVSGVPVVETSPLAGAETCVVELRVSHEGVTTAAGTASLTLDRTAVPVVTAVTPLALSAAGNETVTISGTGFKPEATDPVVTIDGATCTVTASTATSITCTSGALSGTGGLLVTSKTDLGVLTPGLPTALAASAASAVHYEIPWSAAGAWEGAAAPAPGDDVFIARGAALLLDADSVSLGRVVVRGSLRVAPGVTLRAHSIDVSGGSFQVGTAEAPLDADTAIEMVSVTLTGAQRATVGASIDAASAATAALPQGAFLVGTDESGREGTASIVGAQTALAAAAPWARLALPALAGETDITLTDMADLTVGDTIAIVSTSNTLGPLSLAFGDWTHEDESASPVAVELFQVTAAAANVVSLSDALASDYPLLTLPGGTTLGGYVARVSRAVQVRNADVVVAGGSATIRGALLTGSQVTLDGPGCAGTELTLNAWLGPRTALVARRCTNVTFDANVVLMAGAAEALQGALLARANLVVNAPAHAFASATFATTLEDNLVVGAGGSAYAFLVGAPSAPGSMTGNTAVAAREAGVLVDSPAELAAPYVVATSYLYGCAAGVQVDRGHRVRFQGGVAASNTHAQLSLGRLASEYADGATVADFALAGHLTQTGPATRAGLLLPAGRYALIDGVEGTNLAGPTVAGCRRCVMDGASTATVAARTALLHDVPTIQTARSYTYRLRGIVGGVGFESKTEIYHSIDASAATAGSHLIHPSLGIGAQLTECTASVESVSCTTPPRVLEFTPSLPTVGASLLTLSGEGVDIAALAVGGTFSIMVGGDRAYEMEFYAFSADQTLAPIDFSDMKVRLAEPALFIAGGSEPGATPATRAEHVALLGRCARCTDVGSYVRNGAFEDFLEGIEGEHADPEAALLAAGTHPFGENFWIAEAAPAAASAGGVRVRSEEPGAGRYGIRLQTQATAPTTTTPYELRVTVSHTLGGITETTTPAPVTQTMGLWSDPHSWESGAVPTSADSITIPVEKHIVIDVPLAEVGVLTVEGALSVQEGLTLALRAQSIVVIGSMSAVAAGLIELVEGGPAVAIPTLDVQPLILPSGYASGLMRGRSVRTHSAEEEIAAGPTVTTALLVLGSLTLAGEAPPVRATLLNSVAIGDNAIVIEGTATAGDEIVVGAAGTDVAGTETFTVLQADALPADPLADPPLPARTVLALETAATRAHTVSSIALDTGAITIPIPVAVISRTLTVRGGSVIVSSDESGNVVGHADLRNVRFEGGSSIAVPNLTATTPLERITRALASTPAVLFVYGAGRERALAANRASAVVGCAVLPARGAGIAVENVPYVTVDGNTVVNARKIAIYVGSEAAGSSANANTVLGLTSSADLDESTAAGLYVMQASTSVRGNMVAGVHGTALVTRGEDCSPGADGERNVVTASARGMQVLSLYADSCRAVRGLTVHGATHVALLAQDLPSTLRVTDAFLADNHVGIAYGALDASDGVAGLAVSDSTILGTTGAACETTCAWVPTAEAPSPFAADSATCASTVSHLGRVGVLPGTRSGAARSCGLSEGLASNAPDCLLPTQSVACAPPLEAGFGLYRGGVAAGVFSDVTLGYFSPTACGGATEDYVVAYSPAVGDYAPLLQFSGVTWDSSAPTARVALGKAFPGVDPATSDSHKLATIEDADGTFLRSGATATLASALYADDLALGCLPHADGEHAHVCSALSLRILSFSNLDPDRKSNKLTPARVERVDWTAPTAAGVTDGTLALGALALTGAAGDDLCSQTRSGEAVTLPVALDGAYLISVAGESPRKLGLELYASAPEERVVVAMAYAERVRPVLLGGTGTLAGGLVTLLDPAGTFRYDETAKLFTAVLAGSASDIVASYAVYHEPELVLEVTVDADPATVDTTAVCAQMSAQLGVPVSRLHCEVVTESAVAASAGRRLAAAGAIVQVAVASTTAIAPSATQADLDANLLELETLTVSTETAIESGSFESDFETGTGLTVQSVAVAATPSACVGPCPAPVDAPVSARVSVDSDDTPNAVAVTFIFEAARDESDVTGYTVMLEKRETDGTVLEERLVGTVPWTADGTALSARTGAWREYALPVATLLDGHTHLTAYSRNAYGRSALGAAAAVVDAGGDESTGANLLGLWIALGIVGILIPLALFAYSVKQMRDIEDSGALELAADESPPKAPPSLPQSKDASAAPTPQQSAPVSAEPSPEPSPAPSKPTSKQPSPEQSPAQSPRSPQPEFTQDAPQEESEEHESDY